MGEKVQRRLAAVVAADIVGYSRLMAEDEEGTLARVQSLRDQVTEPTIVEHGGRIVKRTGDGTLVEFRSVVDAVRAALSVQRQLPEKQAETQENRIEIRIGINLGDIIIEGDDIFGDGVNIAARLEQLCTPGEILISGAAYDQLAGRSEFSCRYLGEQKLKNIERPIRAYRIPTAPDNEPTESPAGSMAFETPMVRELPDKPSIVVLPFVNMSGDPDQTHFCDGISEDITTALSRFSALFVISRNTAFTFRGQSVKVREVSRELGVQYVLEGSVRLAGNRVRVTAQLIDAINDRHVWAEKFDRDLEDIFAVQDEITARIVGAVAPEVHDSEIKKVQRKSIPELEIWELIVRASGHVTKHAETDSRVGQSLLDTALKQDPNNAQALALLAYSVGFDSIYGWHRSPVESAKRSVDLSNRAISLDDKNETAFFASGFALSLMKQLDKSASRHKIAINLNPNYSPAIGFLGMNYVYAHKSVKADECLERAIRLSPRDPTTIWFHAHVAFNAFLNRRFEDAVGLFKKAIDFRPDVPSPHRGLAASYAMLGELGEARRVYEGFDRLAPGSTVSLIVGVLPFAEAADAELYAEALRRTGVPE